MGFMEHMRYVIFVKFLLYYRKTASRRTLNIMLVLSRGGCYIKNLVEWFAGYVFCGGMFWSMFSFAK
jgi:hypothetical protein